MIALNLHGPIHFARAYLPAGHEARRRGAWCSCARSQGASAGSSPARCVTAKVSAWTVRAAKLAIPNRRWQSGHAGDRRNAWSDGLEWPVQMWNYDAGAISGGSKHRDRCVAAGQPWTSAVRVAGRLPGRLAYPGHPRRARSRGGNHAGSPPSVWILAARPRNHCRSQCALAAKMGPVAAPEAEAPQRSVGQGTPSRSLSVERPTSRAGRPLRLNPENSVAQLRAQHGIAERGRWPFRRLPDQRVSPIRAVVAISRLDPQLGPDGLASGSCSGQSRAGPERSIRAPRDRECGTKPFRQSLNGTTTPALNLRQVIPRAFGQAHPITDFVGKPRTGLHSRPSGERPGFGSAPFAAGGHPKEARHD